MSPLGALTCRNLAARRSMLRFVYRRPTGQLEAGQLYGRRLNYEVFRPGEVFPIGSSSEVIPLALRLLGDYALIKPGCESHGSCEVGR